MEQSASIAELTKALSKFQGEVGPAKKTKTNPHFKSKYADYADLWDVAREPLARNGLSLLQFPSNEGGMIVVTSMLSHTSGEWVKASIGINPEKMTVQGAGSAISYLKRYAMSGILGIPAEEDDDGNEAEKMGMKSAPHKKQLSLDDEFIGGNSEHEQWAVAWLKKNNIEQKLWDEIYLSMHGKPIKDIGKIARSVISRNTPKETVVNVPVVTSITREEGLKAMGIDPDIVEGTI